MAVSHSGKQALGADDSGREPTSAMRDSSAMLEEPKGMGLRLELFHRHRNEIFATARASNRDPRALRKYRDGREIPESRRAGYFEFTDVPSGEYTLRIFPDVELPPDVADIV